MKKKTSDMTATERARRLKDTLKSLPDKNLSEIAFFKLQLSEAQRQATTERFCVPA